MSAWTAYAIPGILLSYVGLWAGLTQGKKYIRSTWSPACKRRENERHSALAFGLGFYGGPVFLRCVPHPQAFLSALRIAALWLAAGASPSVDKFGIQPYGFPEAK